MRSLVQSKLLWGFFCGVGLSSALIVPVLNAHARAAGAVEQAYRSEASQKADQILQKLREIDLLNRLAPLLLTKEQLQKLLDAIELARGNVKRTEAFEVKTLGDLEPKIDVVLNKAMETCDPPGYSATREFSKVIVGLYDTRDLVVKSNEAIVYDALWPMLDKGQKKALAGTINVKEIDPKLKVEDMKDEDIVRYCIRDTILDPLAYPILVKMLKLKS